MEFINLENGLTYNGSSPYIHHFTDGQSTGINYTKVLCVLSEKLTLHINMDSEVFSLLDLSCITNIDNYSFFSHKAYINLEAMKCKKLESKGYKFKDKYIHVFYIVAQSKICGEIIDNFTIDGEEFNICGDFYGEDERLKNSLENFEISFPDSFKGAIYESNVHEEANDNILLNRKYKELLQNYWNIIMSKGSYNSLIDSLKWFEWGDLIRIEEYWKRHDYQYAYLPTEINKTLNSELIQLLNNISKTTFYGLYCCIYKEVPEMFDEEGNPKLDNVLFKWGIDDISLKMTLLGNFYQTYFMPIHLDLLHSSIEHWVFTANKKIMNASSIEFYNTFNNVKTFDCEYDKKPQLKPTKLYFYNDTLFKIGNGCSTKLRYVPSDEVLDKYFKDICAVSRFKCYIPDTLIKRSKVICANGEIIIRDTDYTAYNTNGCIEFELMFLTPGQWNVVLEFETIDCFTYTKELNVYVQEHIYNPLTLYSLTYKGLEDFKCLDTRFNELYFNLCNNNLVTYSNTKLLNVSSDNLNHVLICEVAPKKTTPIVLNYANKILNITIDEIESIKKFFEKDDNYLCYSMGRFGDDKSPLRLIFVSKQSSPRTRMKIKVQSNDNNLRLVDEDRFTFAAFNYKKFDVDRITKNDIIVAIPEFKHSDEIDDCFWVLTNTSTGEVIKSNIWKRTFNENSHYNGNYGEFEFKNTGAMSMLLTEKELTKGYYKLELHYKYDNEIQTVKLDSAFYI